ncbi:MFS transporter [Candidatus Bathyarchaeota archaeon]|nr:MFS transporter [Candidatus Bathyarchaeota archaeon]
MKNVSSTEREIIPRNVMVLTLSRVFWSTSDSSIDSYLPLFMTAMGASPSIIGLITALGSFGAMLLYPVGGYIADKSGRVKLVAYSTLLYVSSFIIYLLAPNWQWVAVASIYQSMVLFYLPAMNAIMADSIPVNERGRLYAFNFALPNLVRILSPYIGGLFIAQFELIPAMRIGFIISFVIGLIVAGMRLLYLNETITQIEKISWNPLKLFPAAYKDMFESLKWVERNIRSYAVLSILMAFLSSMILTFWPIYAVRHLGIKEYLFGAILLWSGVARAVLSFFIGEIVDRIGSRKCFLIGFMTAIPSMYVFTLAKGFWMALPIYTLIVISSVFIWISSQVYLANSIPRRNRGRVMASLGSGMMIGVSGIGFPSGFLIFLPRIFGSLMGGIIYDLDPVLPWIIQTIFLVFGLVYTYFMVHDPVEAYE